MKRRYLGKWELGCVAYHLCACKALTAMPVIYGQIGGAAAALTAAYAGVVSLALLFLLLTVQAKFPKEWNRVCRSTPIRILTAVFWTGAALFALWYAAGILKQVEYFMSPMWYLMLFLVLGAVVTALLGGSAVYRMYALLVLPGALVTAVIVCAGIFQGDVGCLSPILGNGTAAVFGRGLFSVAMYADLLFLLPLLRREVRPEVPIRATVTVGAALGVLTNVAVTLAASISLPYVMRGIGGIPAYLLSDFVFGLETIYLVVFSTSAILYSSFGFYGAWQSLKGISLRRGAKPAAAVLLCIMLCGGLCGCYDAGEVEESAYVIGLGIDAGHDARYRFTFQLSNPLSSAEEAEVNTEESNKTVIHYCEEGENFYTALHQLRSHLGKKPELSQLTLIAISMGLAKEDVGAETEMLLRDGQIRPDTKLCLTDSAEAFLKQVTPRLEESTAKYYSLLFRQQTSPFAPTVDLREFVSKMQDSGIDPVLPIAEGDRLYGMGLFCGGRMVMRMDPTAAVSYLILTGKCKQAICTMENTVFAVTACAPATISVDNQTLAVTVSCPISVQLQSGTWESLPVFRERLQREINRFLQQIVMANADAVGLGRAFRRKFSTETEWEHFCDINFLTNLVVSTEIWLHSEKN